MGTGFYLATLAMLLVALAFVASPFIGSKRQRSSGHAQWPLLFAVACVGLGIALYAAVGKPGLASQAMASSAPPQSGLKPASSGQSASGNRAGTVESLLGGLEQRLEENPADADGWLLLAKSYDHLGRHDAAREAYEKAASLGASDSSLESRLAGSPSREREIAGIAIRGEVRMAAKAAGRVSPGAAVFITAKAVDGSPMPLAVLRKSAGDLPFDFSLDNTHSMSDGQAMKSGELVVVTAKISQSGDALLTDSDLVAVTPPIDPADDLPVELVIGADRSGAVNDGLQ